MNTMRQRAVGLLLALTVLAGLWVPASAASESALNDAAERAAAYMLRTVEQPRVGSVGGEWAVLGLARGGFEVPQTFWDSYYAAVEAETAACKGVLHEKKYTEYARVAIALTAIGADPTDVAGYDLLTPLGDFDKTVWQGINGPVWALLALDAGNYEMPVNPDAKTRVTRQMYVEEILSRQLDCGGWDLTHRGGGSDADADVTGMALQALAKYRDQTVVRDAAERALFWLSDAQDDDGGWSSGGTSNAESTAQVLAALCELGISLDDPRFVKNGHSALDGLLGYQQPDGSFLHTGGGSGSGQMASEQGLYALVAAQRALRGENSLYRMGDAAVRIASTAGTGLPGKHPDVQAPAVTTPGTTFPDIAEDGCRSAAGTLAARGVLTGFADGTFRSESHLTRAQFAAVTVRALGLPQQTAGGFADVASGSWCAGYVGAAHAYGVVNGRTESVFDPDGTITRQEAAVMLARAARLCGLDTALTDGEVLDALAPFGDYRTVGDWAKASVAFCCRTGLFDADALDLEPHRPITRGEAAQAVTALLDAAKLL